VCRENLELMEIGSDSVFSHVARVRHIEANFGEQDRFPVMMER